MDLLFGTNQLCNPDSSKREFEHGKRLQVHSFGQRLVGFLWQVSTLFRLFGFGFGFGQYSVINFFVLIKIIKS